MESRVQQLHIMFFPHLSHGHLIPSIDMARVFASHGVKATIISTPLNAPIISEITEMDKQIGLEIHIRIINFPSTEAALPEGCENLASTTSPQMFNNFFKALTLLQQPLEDILEECRPNCLVADTAFPWATEVAGRASRPYTDDKTTATKLFQRSR
ncbi:scopoletin glucosyltransferase-like [Pistacia vera]|uniref:scopoletin glucosyltransferase-like n=1 Tax=Pistacia vera TaxID=55513 RepID=UPI00126397D7|nr:scopoletin glucosyltransferase-like [Pistacia vera]